MSACILKICSTPADPTSEDGRCTYHESDPEGRDEADRRLGVGEYESVCGETYDHDEITTYEGPDGRQWRCRRCDAEGWEDPEDDT